MLGLIDTGSSCSFISERLASKLDIQGVSHTYTVQTVSGAKDMKSKRVSVSLANIEGTFSQEVGNMLLIDEIPAKYPSVAIDLKKYPYLQGIPMPKIPSNAQCDVLLGMDNSDLLVPLEVRRDESRRNPIYCTRSVFGWSINGIIGNGVPHEITSNHVQCIEEQINRL